MSNRTNREKLGGAELSGKRKDSSAVQTIAVSKVSAKRTLHTLKIAAGGDEREEYDVLEAARIEETTVEWQQEYNRRAGIEGTFWQAVRGYGLRRTRYHGEQKTHLHNLATATAINVVKSVAWLNEKKREQTRISRFAKLKIKEH